MLKYKVKTPTVPAYEEFSKGVAKDLYGKLWFLYILSRNLLKSHLPYLD